MGNHTLLMKMGERISVQRKLLKMTQEELADKLGVSVPMISNLEQGKKAIRPENLVKVCSALDLSADYVLMGKASDDHDYAALFHGIDALDFKEINLINNLIDYMSEKK